LKDALKSFGNGPDRQAKSNARYKMATMEEESREEEEDQDPVYKRIAEHFARDGKGNFKLHVRELAMELMPHDISAENAAKRYSTSSTPTTARSTQPPHTPPPPARPNAHPHISTSASYS
jgi:hypothetical protein